MTAAKIVDVEGCVVREDLYGARLADIDEDGQLEIVALITGSLKENVLLMFASLVGMDLLTKLTSMCGMGKSSCCQIRF